MALSGQEVGKTIGPTEDCDCAVGISLGGLAVLLLDDWTCHWGMTLGREGVVALTLEKRRDEDDTVIWQQ